MKRRAYVRTGVAAAAMVLAAAVAIAVDLTPSVKNDPLVRMPGSQPPPEGGVALEAPTRCLNCHAGYNTAVEPGHNWKGSMMAQAARDFLFFACMTVAGQDSAWATLATTGVASPNAIDICERCHFPQGWIEGRSDPPNASAMTGADYDGVQCDFCHRLFDPFFEDTFAGTREGNDWDETNASSTPSDAAALTTLAEDRLQAQGVLKFDGSPFFANDRPFSPEYTENASGQYFLSTGNDKRASFADAEARHRMLYSRHHKSRYICATCHDVSNPVLANLLMAPGADGSLPTEMYSAFSYFHVERTFSEFMLSDYGQDGGTAGMGPFAPETFVTSNPGNVIQKCQDCHMRDGVGPGCDKNGAPVRPDESIEHPRSGVPIHDLTGGNAWVSYVLASSVPGSPNYDATNDTLLHQGSAVLTLDLAQGLGIDPVALLDGVARAKQQLELAAEIQNVTYDANTGQLSFRIQNQTGHRLISGFPEGRRMFVNVKAYAGGDLVYEVNPYDAAASTLKGLAYPYPPGFGLPLPEPIDPTSEAFVDELVYETHPSSSLTGEDETFHFALATERYKDNRIPPKGYRIGGAAERMCVPRWHGDPAPEYFTADEYAGGYDDVTVSIAGGADYVEITLYYQTTSREYIEFLRDEINGNPDNMTLPTDAYIIQTDPFFAQLEAWGDTVWSLWTHNRNVPGGAPYPMTAAAWPAMTPPCDAPVPTLLSATPGDQQVTLIWSDEHSGNPAVTGYRVYYDQADKVQLLAEVGLTTSFVDTGLVNGVPYRYLVTSTTADCESAYSNVLEATPAPGSTMPFGVDSLVTGFYSGNGRLRTFNESQTFAPGDDVVVRAHVVDATGTPVAGAVVEIQITGSEGTVLTTGSSEASGIAEATWKTTAPKRAQPGTPVGAYDATTINVILDGYSWDGVMTSTSFTLQ